MTKLPQYSVECAGMFPYLHIGHLPENVERPICTLFRALTFMFKIWRADNLVNLFWSVVGIEHSETNRLAIEADRTTRVFTHNLPPILAHYKGNLEAIKQYVTGAQ